MDPGAFLGVWGGAKRTPRQRGGNKETYHGFGGL
jgi:hypothetical protein